TDGGNDSMQRKLLARLMGATAGLLVTGSSPFAADLRPPMAPPAPPPPEFTWTGFELGAQIGGGVSTTNVQVFPVPSNSFSYSGVFGGIHVGFNYQFTNSFLIGLQAEYNFAGISGNSSAPPLLSLETAVREFGSVDGRLGMTFGRLLIYGIGGFAYGDIRGLIQCGPFDCGGFPAPAFPVSRAFAANRYGFDVGGGLEYNIWGNWTARAEYRYYNFGTRGFHDAGFPLNPIAIPPHRSKETMQTGRIGLTYKFAWPTAPVVAKY
ncbi:MAG TPA: outer membrane beta-barrel protein, partial [Methylocella sp.]|nr:outer membrane beta-barrel protein [Methylocella sp.]